MHLGCHQHYSPIKILNNILMTIIIVFIFVFVLNYSVYLRFSAIHFCSTDANCAASNYLLCEKSSNKSKTNNEQRNISQQQKHETGWKIICLLKTIWLMYAFYLMCLREMRNEWKITGENVWTKKANDAFIQFEVNECLSALDFWKSSSSEGQQIQLISDLLCFSVSWNWVNTM